MEGASSSKRQYPVLKLTRGLLALCRQTLDVERHRYSIASPDKLGTDLTAEINTIDTRFSLSVENEQADAGRDGRTCLLSSRTKKIHTLVDLGTSL